MFTSNEEFSPFQTNMAAPMDNPDNSAEVDRNLHQLHYELLRVQNECNLKKMSCYQIKKAARPFLTTTDKKGNGLKKFGVVASILIGLLAVVVYVEPVSRWTSYIRRQMLLKTLPVIDWRSIHGIPCFIGNNFKLEENHLQTEDCQNCSSISSIGMIIEGDTEELSSSYLNKDIPIHINYAESDYTPLSIEDVIQLYLDDDVMRMYTSCEFNSNIKVNKKDHRILLKQIREEKITQYYALWGNCFTEAAKLFRRLYKRPDYLPMSLELTTANGIYICSNYSQTNPVEVTFIEQVMVLLQVSGKQSVKLKPREPCHEQCPSLETTLSAGNLLIVTDFYYDIEFATCGDDSSITLQLGAKWDS